MSADPVKEYMVVLWNDKYDENQDIYPHKIEEFEFLRDAVVFLVKNGAKFDKQEIVKKVNWMPNSETRVQEATTPAQPHVMTPEEEELAKRPNPTGAVQEQPNVIGDSGNTPAVLNPVNKQGRLKKHIFEGIIPDAMLPSFHSDD